MAKNKMLKNYNIKSIEAENLPFNPHRAVALNHNHYLAMIDNAGGSLTFDTLQKNSPGSTLMHDGRITFYKGEDRTLISSLIQKGSSGFAKLTIRIFAPFQNYQACLEIEVEVTGSPLTSIKMKNMIRDLYADEDLRKKIQRNKKRPRKLRHVITIVNKDWLSKISWKRFKSIKWSEFLELTDKTRQDRKKLNLAWNENRIYPGDTFWIKQGIKQEGRSTSGTGWA